MNSTNLTKIYQATNPENSRISLLNSDIPQVIKYNLLTYRILIYCIILNILFIFRTISF
jgi:hypothetical protein